MKTTTCRRVLLLLVVMTLMLPVTSCRRANFWGIASTTTTTTRGSLKVAAAVTTWRGGSDEEYDDTHDEKTLTPKEQLDDTDISVERTTTTSTTEAGWKDRAETEDIVNAMEDDNEIEEDEQQLQQAPSIIEIQPFMQQEDEISQSSFATALDDPSIDDDSSAFVDRMELADDEGETTPGSFEVENVVSAEASVISDPAANDEGDSPTSGNSQLEDESSTEQKIEASTEPVIDAVMRRVLIKELKYTSNEVKAMKYDIAVMIVEKRLYRPMEGMPANWYRDGTSSGSSVSKIITRIAIPVMVGALAFGAATKGGFDSPHIFTLPFPRNKTPVDAPAEIAETTPPDSNSKDAEDDDNGSVKPVNEHVDALGAVHPHSIKPGQIPKDEMDVTWLDKAITAVEKKIKALIRMEI
jgi:hypothetical protein